MEDKSIANKEHLKALVEGTIDWEDAKKLMRLKPKDEDRFLRYLEVLQERVSWKDKILCRMSEHLYVVRKGGDRRVVKCGCGQEFGDYRINWKLSANIRVRRGAEEISKAYSLKEVVPNPDFVEAREYYCPGCFSQLAVEVVPTGYPVIFEMLPDIDQAHQEAGAPLDDESKDWFQDKTKELLSEWIKKVEVSR